MLDITSDDIALLDDDDLRSLVGRLCESELHSLGLPTSAVTWGGHQNAADGGIDVRVRLNDDLSISGDIPRVNSGYQVKKTDFTPALIRREMRPEDNLRDSIRTLIKDRGAYILVSSGANASDTALSGRVDAMRDAVADEKDYQNLHVDFFDRCRLATWVRKFPGLIVWVRQKVGRSISGWQPYSSWAASPDGINDDYLLDDRTRMHFGALYGEGVDAKQGIDRIRSILRNAKGVVRLIGLSGVGKTRLVQALFDSKVGDNRLDPSCAIYTDMTDNPSPQPIGMISDLIAQGRRAIIVVDNCPPDLHRRIAEVCKAADSNVSAITVEYDVRDDEPEGTEVVRLEPSSNQLVSNLLLRRFPAMEQLDADRIAEFAGGNSRVALAIANAFEKHESVAGLRDEELFRRLFYQRQGPDEPLLKAAQACALLYSFDGEAIEGNTAELPTIAALVGMDTTQLFAKVAELKRRGLAQSRGVWRAILPHAIANRLAAMALRDIPFTLIERQFNSDRLLRSFSRRLSYLHESDEAKRIAINWLRVNGRLGDPSRLSELDLAIFENIAPVAPEATLAAIETGISGPSSADWFKDGRNRERIGRLLRLIAWDAIFFERCVEVLVAIVVAEPTNQGSQLRKTVEELFHLFDSGTHAKVEQRTEVVENLLCSSVPERQSLGLQLLQALLTSREFWTYHSPGFGARPVDYGFRPRNREEVQHWFATVLQMTRRSVASQNLGVVTAIRSIVARGLSDVWFIGTAVQDCFEELAAGFAATGYWEEGWIAVRHVLSRLNEHEQADVSAVERLRHFENSLRPKDFVEEVRAVVISEERGAIDYAEMDCGSQFDSDRFLAARKRAFAAAEELGRMISRDESALATLLPDLVRSKSSRLFVFGMGLAHGSEDYLAIWNQLVQAAINTDESRRTPDLIGGFLNGIAEHNRALCEWFLDEVLSHDILCVWLPYLQFAAGITFLGVRRLKRAATKTRTPAAAFHILGYRPGLTAQELSAILLLIARKSDGFGVAIDILAMRLHTERSMDQSIPHELITAGRYLLSAPNLSVRHNSYDYELSDIAKVCLCGDEGATATRLLCEYLLNEALKNVYRAYHFEQLLSVVFECHPRIALDVLLGGEPKSSDVAADLFNADSSSSHRINPLQRASTEEIVRWCEVSPGERYAAMARIAPYQTVGTDGGVAWTTTAMETLRRAPDPIAVLKIYVSRFSPISWSGSRAAIMESRIGLLASVRELNNPSLDEYAMGIRPELLADAAAMRRWEDAHDSERDERFE